MENLKHKTLSTNVKVNNEGGITTIEHSDAYDELLERFFSGEKFSKQQKAEIQKLIDAEETQMSDAQRDPVTFIARQQAKAELGSSSHIVASADDNVKKNQATVNMPEEIVNTSASRAYENQAPLLNEEQRLEISKQAFADASLSDRAIAEKNLIGLQAKLLDVAKYMNMTSEQLALAQQKAFMDEGEKLHALNIIANTKSNALTWEVANFSQGAGKTMVSADVGGNATGVSVGGEVHHGIKVPGLDLAEVNATTSTTDDGLVSGSVGVKAVKNVYSNGDHNVFLAAAANMTASNLSRDSTQLGGNVTGLVVNTHTLAGRPTSEIGGASVDVLTGNTTLVGSVAQTFNADTKYATTVRAIGTVGVESGSGGFSLEAYQRTGIEGLTARLNMGLADISDENEPSAGAGLNFSW